LAPSVLSFAEVLPVADGVVVTGFEVQPTKIATAARSAQADAATSVLLLGTQRWMLNVPSLVGTASVSITTTLPRENFFELAQNWQVLPSSG
jgi:hypothetical protein